tara:strand:- start:154 stop:2067 length:1914 start_codon:yes stop_codon:yes gene_type:complete
MAGIHTDVNFTTSANVVNGGDTPAGAQPPSLTTKLAAAQAAALMRLANSSTSDNPHNPPTNWSCDDSIARNGAYHSNLVRGAYGPIAVDLYISEDFGGIGGTANDGAVHRKLLLQLAIQELASGDVADSSSSANAIYVSGNLISPTPSADFVTWPNSGCIPYQITPDRWSVRYRGADFTSATIVMKDEEDNVINTTTIDHSSILTLTDDYFVWKPDSSAIPSTASEDQTFTITISNIQGSGVPSSLSYSVTVIDPDRLNDDLHLSGSSTPPTSGGNYFFTPVEAAENYRLKISSLLPAMWTESASSASTIINQTALDDSEIRSTNSFQSSPRSLRIAFEANTETFTAIELDRTFIPNAGAQVNFYSRRGLMLNTTTWALQIKGGSGIWTDFHTITDPANSGLTENNFTLKNIDIPSSYNGISSSLRIVLRKSALHSSYFTGFSSVAGVFTDDISLTNCDELTDINIHTYSSLPIDNVTFDATTTGSSLVNGDTYLLSLGVTVGCKDFGYGQAVEVAPTNSLTGYDLWYHGSYPIIGNFDDDYDNDGIGNGLEYTFGLTPLDSADANDLLKPQMVGDSLQLSHSIISGETVEAEYSYTLEAGSWNSVTVTNSGGVATASFAVPTGKTECFIRWKAIEP